MNQSEVMQWLETNQDARGIAHWNRLTSTSSNLTSFGIGLTRLRKFAKEIGRDRPLAQKLWKVKNYEAKVLALLIDDPKLITQQQAEQQVEQLQGGFLSHVFSSCDATLAKTPFVVELADKWIVSKDPVRRGCGYGLLYEVSKSKKSSAPDDAYFLAHIERIDKKFDKEVQSVRGAMGCALMGIGKRNRPLRAAALRVAERIGPIEFETEGDCEPLDIVKHLTSEYLQKKLGV